MIAKSIYFNPLLAGECTKITDEALQISLGSLWSWFEVLLSNPNLSQQLFWFRELASFLNGHMKVGMNSCLQHLNKIFLGFDPGWHGTEFSLRQCLIILQRNYKVSQAILRDSNSPTISLSDYKVRVLPLCHGCIVKLVIQQLKNSPQRCWRSNQWKSGMASTPEQWFPPQDPHAEQEQELRSYLEELLPTQWGSHIFSKRPWWWCGQVCKNWETEHLLFLPTQMMLSGGRAIIFAITEDSASSCDTT